MFENTLEFARTEDKADSLNQYRDQFIFPKMQDSTPYLYFTGNSLGLQPKQTKAYVDDELKAWAELGVLAHTDKQHRWIDYHELVAESMAQIVGAKPAEVVAMNSLTVNLHLMMVSFYRPTKKRYKILIEANAFPSDRYAVMSQLAFHGVAPDGLLEVNPPEGEYVISTEQILKTIEEQGDEVALILIGGVQYFSGQAFEMEQIVKAGHAKGCFVGFDLAHAAGNLCLKLHNWQVDFAVWCTYKYLNSGPGGIGACFVHEKHYQNDGLPKFKGWWGTSKQDRFQMLPDFDPIPSVESWQLSNPPIFQLAALRASLAIFDKATMPKLREKSVRLTAYLEFLLQGISDTVTVITPGDPSLRGCQLSLKFIGDEKAMLGRLEALGIICDFRYPDIVRVAPTPLYNSFEDVYRFYSIVRDELS